jgi:hypothetical protein
MIRNLIFLLFIVFFSASYSFGQSSDIKIGSSTKAQYNYGGYFDYSEPATVNINVSVWGNVRYPGKYTVPENMSVRDIISYAGGPTNDAHLEDLRLYRILPDSSQTMIKFSYNDLLWKDHLTTSKVSIPNLSAGDVILVPGEPRLYYHDYFTMTLTVASTLISLAILVIDIIKK